MKSPKSKYKIAFVIDDSLDLPNGVQQMVKTFGGWLSEQGHEVHYITGYSKDSQNERIHSLSKIISASFNGNTVGSPKPVSKARVRKLLDRHNFDIIHIQSPHSPFLSSKIIQLADRETSRLISSFHVLPLGKLDSFFIKLLGRIVRSDLERIDLFTANSPASISFLKKAWRIEQVEMLPMPVDSRIFRKQPRKFRKEDKINISFLGRLEIRKNIIRLIEALHLLPPEVLQGIHFHIGGSGHLKDKVGRMISTGILRDLTTIYGFVDETDKPGFLASADICVLPSIGGESFGISLVEAMFNDHGLVLAGHNAGYDSILGQRPDMMFDGLSPQSISNCLLKWLKASQSERQEAADWQTERAMKYDLVTSTGPLLLDFYNE